MRIIVFVALIVLSAAWGIHTSAASSEATMRNKQPDPFIQVSGGVRQPGRYDWTNGMTVLDGIHAAGGFDESAGRRIEIYRFARFQRTPNGEVAIYGKTEIYDRGNFDVTNQPPRLFRGDEILVERRKRIL